MRTDPRQGKTQEEAMLESLLAWEQNRAQEKMLIEAQREGERIREECHRLIGFIGHAWRILEPVAELKIGWAIDAMAEHLEAIHYRYIKNLLTNVPPGMLKSLMTNVFFPAWEWGPKDRSDMRYVCTSYGLDLTNRDGEKFLRLITSEWYQTLWTPVNVTKFAVDNIGNSNTGVRIGVPWSKSMGRRGGRFMFDDPHDLLNAEADDQRATTVRLFKEGASSRLNDPETDSMIGIMQRLNQGDISGYILENDPSYTHLMLPQEFEPERKCITYRKDGTKLFEDPRTKEGELVFPERFNRAYVDFRKSAKGIGAYAYAAQDQQRPTPRGGGLFQKTWFDKRTVQRVTDLPAKIVRTVRAWDLAATDLKALQTTGARSAGVKMAKLANDEYAILGCVARGYGPAKVKALMKTTAKADGKGVEISAPQDPAQAGKVQRADIIKSLAGFTVSVTTESGDKAARFTPFSVQCEEGNVWIVDGPWVQEFFEELEPFPNGKRKDIGDACSRAFGHLTTKRQRRPVSTAGTVAILLQAEADAEA